MKKMLLLCGLMVCFSLVIFTAEIFGTDKTASESSFDLIAKYLSDKSFSDEEIKAILDTLDKEWKEEIWGPATLAQLRSMGVDQQKASILIIALLLDIQKTLKIIQARQGSQVKGLESDVAKQLANLNSTMKSALGALNDVWEKYENEKSKALDGLRVQVKSSQGQTARKEVDVQARGLETTNEAKEAGDTAKELKEAQKQAEELRRQLNVCQEEKGECKKAYEILQYREEGLNRELNDLQQRYLFLYNEYQDITNFWKGHFWLQGGAFWGREVYPNPYGALVDSLLYDPAFFSLFVETGARVFSRDIKKIRANPVLNCFLWEVFIGGPEEMYVGTAAKFVSRYGKFGGGIVYSNRNKSAQGFIGADLEWDYPWISLRWFLGEQQVQVGIGAHFF